jgi:FlaA1/EpsC-like NDP-sugar epimerase
MLQRIKSFHLYSMMLFDAAIFIVALVVAYFLRFDFTPPPVYLKPIWLLLPVLIPLKLAVFYAMRLYKGIWRYFSVEDTWRLAYASLIATLLTITFIVYAHGFMGFPRSVFVMDGVLTFLLCGILRLGIRSYYTARNTSKGTGAFSLPQLGQQGAKDKRVLILGAGGAGEKMLREIFDNPHLHYSVVGFLDDDPGKQGRSLHGIPVLGGVEQLPKVAEDLEVERVFISVPSATGPEMRRLVEICKQSGIPHKTLPAIGEIINGNLAIALREVNYEDLLRRPPIHLDMAGIHDYLTGRRVLITGCGGSIGSELCRQVMRFNPEELLLVDASEGNLYSIETELQHDLNFDQCRGILGRVQDRRVMAKVFEKYRPHVVFHAAACKHVPLLEKIPWEAVFNNVLGSQVVMETALECGVERFVLVSTDKAVRPANVMGACKRIAELLLQSLQGNGAKFMAVRFGNVIGSSGSVVPFFQRQIERGGPVTVTHPEITRYFMSIPEASQLILQAAALGEGGEIFVLEMGTPVLIADMARDLIRLSGKEPDRDIQISYVGLRPGEKLFEELISSQEGVANTPHEKIMVLQPNGNWCGHGSQDHFCRWLNTELEELYSVANQHDARRLRHKLKQIVTSYSGEETECIL